MVSSITTISYSSLLDSEAMQKRRTDLFQKVDSDSSGGIDKTEFSAFAVKMAEMSGASLDSDTLFSQYDADGDGSLSTEELDSFMKENAPSLPPPPGGMGGPGGPINAQEAQQMLEDLFGKVDSDSSGSISQSEFSAFIEKMTENSDESTTVKNTFAKYDANSDNSLSADEFASFMKDNPPPPPPFMAMQNAMSAYGSNMSTDQLTSLLNSLSGNASDSSSATTDLTSLTSDLTSLTSQFVSKLMELIGQRASSETDSLLISVQA
jgi:Ca2+-binding EF-hand superfamily protein